MAGETGLVTLLFCSSTGLDNSCMNPQTVKPLYFVSCPLFLIFLSKGDCFPSLLCLRADCFDLSRGEGGHIPRPLSFTPFTQFPPFLSVLHLVPTTPFPHFSPNSQPRCTPEQTMVNGREKRLPLFASAEKGTEGMV